MYLGMNKLWLQRGKVSWWMHTAVFVADIQMLGMLTSTCIRPSAINHST